MASADLQESEPPEVVEARAVLERWRLRNGHDAYVEPLGGGHLGYQGQCWDCPWHGEAYLRGDEPMGTPESRAHKRSAYRDVEQHREATTPAGWRAAHPREETTG